MIKKRYPIIDHNKCTNCLLCVEFCPRNVIREEDGEPKIVDPDNCVEFCLGCQEICKENAITYFWDEKDVEVRK